MCIVVRLVRSLLVLRCCSFLSGHQLILCAVAAGTAETVPSYQAGWQRCLALFSIHLGIVPSSARQPLGRFVPPPAASRWGESSSSARQPLGRVVPHPPVGVLPAPSQALGRLTDRCVVIVSPSSSRRGRICLLP